MVIAKVSDSDDNPSIDMYHYNARGHDIVQVITKLYEMIDPYDTEIIVCGHPTVSKLTYINQVYGSLTTLKTFGIINKLTFIDDYDKIYKRIFRYIQAGRKRKRNIDVVSDMLHESSSCPFYNSEINYRINNSTGLQTMYKLAVASCYYMIIKNRLST